MKYPEYNDVEKAEKIFTFLDDKENLKKLVASSDADGIHLYTMNKPYIAQKIFPAVESMR